MPAIAQQLPSSLLCLLGFVAWGDLGPLTLYTNKRGRLVAFPKTFPKGEVSHEQTAQRAKFTAAAAAWQALTPSKRAQWELASRRASLCMHGYDLFVHWHTLADDRTIATLERQTSTSLLPP